MAHGLQGEWATQFDAWGPAIEHRVDQVESTPVKILVWGPGESWGIYYDKRIQIRDHLRRLNRYNDARTSEEIEKEHARLKDYHTHDREALQIESGDLIILLIVKEPKITGVQTEVAAYRRQRDFYNKARLLIPRLTTRERERFRSFLSHGWIDYPREHCLLYTQQQFDDGKRLLDYCADQTKRVRDHLYFDTHRPGD
jgi:hypothetical protein